MKTRALYAFFFLAVVTFSSFSGRETVAPAVLKQETGFSHFRAHRQGAGVALSWAVANPAVTHFQIERSYDGEFFETIATMGCSGSGTHRFQDEQVFPGYIYYRIAAVSSNGETQYSPVDVVRLVRRG